jgi:hypothetical protein
VLELEECSSVLDSALDLQAISYDALARHEPFHLARGKAGDLVWVEIGKGITVSCATFQDGEPAQPRLSALQDEHLKELAIVVYRNSPLVVVVVDVEGIA